MASDDRYDDEPGAAPRVPSVVERAKSAVKGPAIALILTGLVSLGFVGLGAIQLGSVGRQFEEAKKQFDADPNMNPQQRQEAKQMMDNIQKVLLPILPAMYLVQAAVGALTLAAGFKLNGLSGRGLAITASVLNMIPVLSGFCCLGLPVGIWTIIVLSGAEVKAGFAAEAARRRGPETLDDFG